MKNLQQLREERAALLNRATAIVDIAKTENRELTADEASEVDKITGADIDAIDAAIKRQEKLEARIADMAKRQAPPAPGSAVNVRDPLNLQRHGALKGYQNREEAFRAGCWFAATFLNHAKATEWCQLQGITVQNAASAGSNAAGGFLVPEEMERSIIQLVEEYGVFRRNVRVMPMSSDTATVPRRTAGVTAYYVGEVPSSITESSPTFGQAQLVARVLAVRSLFSRDLAEDAVISIADFITTEIALAFAYAEDVAGFSGDGTSTYGGIVGLKNALAAGSKYTAATGNTAFSTLDNEDFLGMVGKLPQYALSGAKWYISQAGYWNSMARLQAAGGGNTFADLGAGPVLQYMGFPVVISQVMNSTITAQTSTDGLAYFGNLGLAATMGSRRGIEAQLLQELYAGTRQLGIISTQRYDINVHERGDASNAGPIVMLSTPGS